MPLAFPSHQGLILPLQRVFPRRIDGVALCAGAAMPDLFDGAAGLFRGTLGRWSGHSLAGIPADALLGFLLSPGLRGILREKWISRLDPDPPPGPPGPIRALFSAALGSLSHILFDLAAHGSTQVLWPWHPRLRLFPSWWNEAWGSIPLPFYREAYPLAPHTVAWVFLTLLGTVLFFTLLGKRGPRPLPPPHG